MDSIFRGAFIYVFLLVVFRVAGKRTLTQATTFDFVLLLIISESIQQAMIDTDNSVINAVLIVITLVGLDITLSLWKQRSKRLEQIVDGCPLVIIEDGAVHRRRLQMERVDEEDILSAARELHGLERMEQIKYAVIERGGRITIIPRR